MLVYKIMNQNIQILNKTVPIAITLHVYVLIAGDERRQSLHTNQLARRQSEHKRAVSDCNRNSFI